MALRKRVEELEQQLAVVAAECDGFRLICDHAKERTRSLNSALLSDTPGASDIVHGRLAAMQHGLGQIQGVLSLAASTPQQYGRLAADNSGGDRCASPNLRASALLDPSISKCEGDAAGPLPGGHSVYPAQRGDGHCKHAGSLRPPSERVIAPEIAGKEEFQLSPLPTVSLQGQLESSPQCAERGIQSTKHSSGSPSVLHPGVLQPSAVTSGLVGLASRTQTLPQSRVAGSAVLSANPGSTVLSTTIPVPASSSSVVSNLRALSPPAPPPRPSSPCPELPHEQLSACAQRSPQSPARRPSTPPQVPLWRSQAISPRRALSPRCLRRSSSPVANAGRGGGVSVPVVPPVSGMLNSSAKSFDVLRQQSTGRALPAPVPSSGHSTARVPCASPPLMLRPVQEPLQLTLAGRQSSPDPRAESPVRASGAPATVWPHCQVVAPGGQVAAAAGATSAGQVLWSYSGSPRQVGCAVTGLGACRAPVGPPVQ